MSKKDIMHILSVGFMFLLVIACIRTSHIVGPWATMTGHTVAAVGIEMIVILEVVFDIRG